MRISKTSPALPSNRQLSGSTIAARPPGLSVVMTCWTKLICLLLVLSMRCLRVCHSDSVIGGTLYGCKPGGANSRMVPIARLPLRISFARLEVLLLISSESPIHSSVLKTWLSWEHGTQTLPAQANCNSEFGVQMRDPLCIPTARVRAQPDVHVLLRSGNQ